MKIAYLDLFYRINGDLHQDMKVCCQTVFSNEFPLIDDLSDLEIYEIMRQPVIQLLPLEKAKRLDMRLEMLCYSYLSGILFIYLFSNGKWNYYTVGEPCRTMKFYL
jgi:hypothetical protein